MRNIRIHVDTALQVGAEIQLPAQAAEHVARVLRLGNGDALTLFNGDGCDYRAVIVAATKRVVTVVLQAAQPLHSESPLALTLAQGIARGDKMDLVVQKATELGVQCIVPLLTERSEVKLDAERAEKRLIHWRAVAASACEQSGRACLPHIQPVQTLQAWLDALNDEAGSRLALLPDAALSTRDLCLDDPAAATLVVGPEGGLGQHDVDALDHAGFTGLRLGPRILRTETAGLAALASLQALHGDG